MVEEEASVWTGEGVWVGVAMDGQSSSSFVCRRQAYVE